MSRTIRYIKRGVKGRVKENFNWPDAIKSAKAIVNVTVGEIKAGTTTLSTLPPIQDFYYILGDADVWVSNIGVHKNDFNREDPGGIGFIVHVDFDVPLDVAITITVEDYIPEEIQGY
jgi:hypothetical protein